MFYLALLLRILGGKLPKKLKAHRTTDWPTPAATPTRRTKAANAAAGRGPSLSPTTGEGAETIAAGPKLPLSHAASEDATTSVAATRIDGTARRRPTLA